MRTWRALATLALFLAACGQTSAAATPASPSPAASAASPSPASPAGLWPRTTSLAFDSTRGQVVLFGGAVMTSVANDTWTWQNRRWTQVQPATTPPSRSGQVLVDDPEMKAVLMFGGEDGNGKPLGDTWAWNGANWSLLAPAHSPPARYGAAATFDAVRHVVLMFGGSGNLNDTWIWNGQDWSQAKPQQSPPARINGRLAVDVAHGDAVLFGGFEARQDTWTWDGINWTQRTTGVTPPGIHEPRPYTEQMAYDSTLKAIVLAAPNESTNATETYTWSGTDWTKLGPATSPPFRDGAGLAYDDADSLIVLAGGYERGQSTSETTWGFDGTNWSSLS